MARRNGFTLIELLVVIAIIALLLSILVPALKAARDEARLAACLSLIRSYGNANHLYANANNGFFVPFSQPHARPGYGWDERWCENRTFRNYISVSARVKIEDLGWNDAFMWPKELRCPAQKIGDIDEYTRALDTTEGFKVVMSYGLNVEQWRRDGDLTKDDTWWPNDGGYYGHTVAGVKNPSAKMMFIDNNYYQARYERAKYTLEYGYWEKYGEYISKANLGQTCYRHRERASLCYFDGHAGYLKKEEVHVGDPRVPAPHNIYKRPPNELWDIDKKGLKEK